MSPEMAREVIEAVSTAARQLCLLPPGARGLIDLGRARPSPNEGGQTFHLKPGDGDNVYVGTPHGGPAGPGVTIGSKPLPIRGLRDQEAVWLLVLMTTCLRERLPVALA